MGNSIAINLKEDTTLKITEEMVQSLQSLVRNVDYSMTGFVKTLDSLRGTCELLLRQIDKLDQSSQCKQGDQDSQPNLTEEAYLVVRILRTIDESASDQKISTLQSLAKLLHYIIDTGKKCIDLPAENFLKLSLDQYVVDQRVESTLDLGLPYYETRVEDLRKELACLYDLNDSYRDEIRNLNKIEHDLSKEIEILRNTNQDLEKQVKLIRSNTIAKGSEQKGSQTEPDYEIITPKNNNLPSKDDLLTNQDLDGNHFAIAADPLEESPYKDEKKVNRYNRWNSDHSAEHLLEENQRLKAKLERLYSKECIHVQFLYASITKHSVGGIIEMLKKKIETPECKLFIRGIKCQADIDYQFPVVVFCNSIQSPTVAAKDALKDIEVMEKIALVFVHKNITPTAIRCSGSAILKGKHSDFQKELGGIFDVLRDYRFNIAECDLNEKNIADLTSFILTNGVKKSQIESHGIE